MIFREQTVLLTSLKDSYIEIGFKGTHKAGNHDEYVNVDDKNLVSLAPIPLSSEYYLTTLSENRLESFDYDFFIFLLFKLKTSSKDSIDLPIGLDASNQRRKEEVTENKKEPDKRRYHPRINSKEVSWYAEHQRNSTLGIGYKLTEK